jgi:aminoglycoside phosphotransferase (APT) family kinase protein
VDARTVRSVTDDEPAAPAGIPPAETPIDEALVRALLREQHPDLAGQPLRHAATGWDNVTYRLGDRLAVRLPRIGAAVAPLRHEQRWLPVLAGWLPVPVPAPVRVGGPGQGYPWPWSVVPWVPGRTAAQTPLADTEAARFGRFLAAVHRPAPEGFPRNDYRAVPLIQVADQVEERLRRLPTMDGVPAVPWPVLGQRWRAALAAPVGAADTCVHGDLHPRNVVVDGGRLAAVLDWGDMTTGDRAADLGAAWMLFPPGTHADIWAAGPPPSAHTLARAAGWGVFFGLSLLEAGLAGDAVFAAAGRLTLHRLAGA